MPSCLDKGCHPVLIRDAILSSLEVMNFPLHPPQSLDLALIVADLRVHDASDFDFFLLDHPFSDCCLVCLQTEIVNSVADTSKVDMGASVSCYTTVSMMLIKAFNNTLNRKK